jgi:hypothetical protein
METKSRSIGWQGRNTRANGRMAVMVMVMVMVMVLFAAHTTMAQVECLAVH